MKAVIYARYSSDRQEDRSIEDQVALCEGYARREGLRVVQVYDDRALSGASTIGRMGLQRLMADARERKFDVVIAEALDRLSRDQEDLAGLHKRLSFAGIEIRTVQDGAVGDIHVGVKGLLGSLYLRDLAAKTHRGLAGVVRDGRHAGGRAYGYNTVPGAPGELTIDLEAAEIVQRIFREYADGRTPREIAVGLNRDRVPPPRGSAWTQSAINGSRIRRNGILNNDLYQGVIVWNRQSFMKDPDTGKRVSRPNPEALWQRSDAPDLRIIGGDLWSAVHGKRQEVGGEHPQIRRPKRIFSGLLKCGCCDGSYTVSGSDRRGVRLECSTRRETGNCDNRRSVSAVEVETRALEGIRKYLLDPEIVADWLRTYHEERETLRRTISNSRTAAESALANVEARLQRVMKLYEDGMIELEEAKPRLQALKQEKRDAEDALAATQAGPLVTLHPGAIESYREQLACLHRELSEGTEDARTNAVERIRSLVEKIVIRPSGEARGPFDVEIHGRLASFLRREGEEGAKPSVGTLVAGTRNTRFLQLIETAIPRMAA